MSSGSGSTLSGPIFYMDGDIVIRNAKPVNTSGGFGDLFIGIHPTQGKLALKRLKGAGGNDKQQRVSWFSVICFLVF